MEVLLVNDIFKKIILYIYSYCNQDIELTIMVLKSILIQQDYTYLEDKPFYQEIIKEYKSYLMNVIYSEVLEILTYKNDDQELLNYD